MSVLVTLRPSSGAESPPVPSVRALGASKSLLAFLPRSWRVPALFHFTEESQGCEKPGYWVTATHPASLELGSGFRSVGPTMTLQEHHDMLGGGESEIQAPCNSSEAPHLFPF